MIFNFLHECVANFQARNAQSVLNFDYRKARDIPSIV
jgi:hypothetical protein